MFVLSVYACNNFDICIEVQCRAESCCTVIVQVFLQNDCAANMCTKEQVVPTLLNIFGLTNRY